MQSPFWVERARAGKGPPYQRLLESLTLAIRSDELRAGDRLPPQRAVAAWLGVDLTTVTRALNAARERGLVEGVVGRGTFVRRLPAEGAPGVVDLSMTLPPPPAGVSLGALLSEAVRELLATSDVASLMAYHPGAGSRFQRTAGAAWVRPFLGPVDDGRVRICAGAQTGIASLLSSLRDEVDAVVTEPLVYPGLLAAAAQAGLPVIACPADAQGIVPDAAAKLARQHGRVVFAVCPTLQNPTGATMGMERRRALAKVVDASGALLLEDDPYAMLLDEPLKAISSFVPERSYYLASLSKCLTPGLRVATAAAPDEARAERWTGAMRALSLMPSPLTAAVAATWMSDGAAERIAGAVRTEAKARRRIAREALPSAVGGDASLHVWLDLPTGEDELRLAAAARNRGLSLVTSTIFRAGEIERSGVRLSLGGPARKETLRPALLALSRDLESPGRPLHIV